MKNLLIIGARGYGVEVCNLAQLCVGFGQHWQIKGFLDDQQTRTHLPYPIVSSVENYQPEQDDVFICALGDVKYKLKYIKIIQEKGGNFINLISKNSQINSDFSNAKGLIIESYSIISSNVTLGDFVTVQGFVTLGHDAQVGAYSHLSTYSFMGGYAVIGDSVQLYTRATLIPHVRVGNNAVIGAASLVIKDVPGSVTVIGNPAKILQF